MTPMPISLAPDDLELDLQHCPERVANAVERLEKIISQQQNDIIMLEIERDALTEEIRILKQRNDNQASLLVAIEEGKAKKCPDGGWYKT